MAKNTLNKKHPKVGRPLREGAKQTSIPASKALKKSGKAAPSNAPN